MRLKPGILIVIILLFVIGPCTAYIPDTSTISAGDTWVIANRVDQTSITVFALNATYGAIKNALVEFSVDDKKYGSVSPATDKTDNSGRARSVFKVNRTSGIVTITARITSDGLSVIRNVTVNIDHNSPYSPYFDYPLSATVGSEVPFNISITDYWGNRIDNRRGPHTYKPARAWPGPG